MKPIFTQKTNWKGVNYIEEFYPVEMGRNAERDPFRHISPITQVQAVTLLNNDVTYIES